MEESSVLSELQNLREQLEKNEVDREALETQLSEANSTVTQLQEEGSGENPPQKSFLANKLNGNCKKRVKWLNVEAKVEVTQDASSSTDI